MLTGKKIFMASVDSLRCLFEDALHVTPAVWTCRCATCDAVMAAHAGRPVAKASVLYARTGDERVYFMANVTFRAPPAPTFWIENVEDIAMLLASDLVSPDEQELFRHWFTEGDLKTTLLSAPAQAPASS
jgi:hypothetical protein